MAFRRKRRSSRKLDELPGLFDDIRVPDHTDHVLEILQEQRSKQISATPAEAEFDPVTGNVTLHRQLQFISLGSGSSGNCAYIGMAGEGGVIIDAGIDAEKTISTLRANCIPIDKIAGIIVTHDHSDHVKYAYPLLRKLNHPLLYCTPRTLEGILRRHSISRRIKDFHKGIFKEFAFDCGPFTITPFEVSHDGSDNVGFCISVNHRNFVIATDMGSITERADHYMRQADWLMIESNYDAAMLATGSYPEYLKARIRSDIGHLNNTVTAEYLSTIWSPKLMDIYLCHLSQDNNKPEIALRVVSDALMARGIAVGDGSGSVQSRHAQVRVSALPRYDASPLFVHRI